MICEKTYLLLALDPVHVDSGEAQLGRVDNFIIRDPSDGCPKIPGTSLHGAIRHNAALFAATRVNRSYLNCSGQIRPENQHENCPICWTFGRPPESESSSGGHVGKAAIYDGIIFFFPVNTMYGLVYLTTPRLLKKIGLQAVDATTGQGFPLNLSFPHAYRTDTNQLPELSVILSYIFGD